MTEESFKVHMRSSRGFAICSTSQFYELTSEREEVTCKRCLRILDDAKQSELARKSIETTRERVFSAEREGRRPLGGLAGQRIKGGMEARRRRRCPRCGALGRGVGNALCFSCRGRGNE